MFISLQSALECLHSACWVYRQICLQENSLPFLAVYQIMFFLLSSSRTLTSIHQSVYKCWQNMRIDTGQETTTLCHCKIFLNHEIISRRIKKCRMKQYTLFQQWINWFHVSYLEHEDPNPRLIFKLSVMRPTSVISKVAILLISSMGLFLFFHFFEIHLFTTSKHCAKHSRRSIS